MLYMVIAVSLLVTAKSEAQYVQNSWGVGFGISYPRFVGVTTTSISKDNNYGAFLSLKRSFSEHVAFRLTGNYVNMKTLFYKNVPDKIETTNLLSGDLDFIYKFLPCSKISPYALLGFGGNYFNTKNSATPAREGNHVGYQMNMGLGFEWIADTNWSISTELNYNTSNDNELEGNSNLDELKGILSSNGDTYMKLSIGAIYYFSRGEKSTICEPLPQGIKNVTAAAPVFIEKVKIDTVYKEKIIEQKKDIDLFGINFKFDSDKLMPESYPILDHAAKLLKKNPEIRVEIQGYTDNIGPELYNQTLSNKRARTIRRYLIKNGISPSRLFAKGFGESNPVKSNKTRIGRAFNRRIEFKIIGVEK